MIHSSTKDVQLVLASFLLAMVCAVVPLSASLNWWRPEWVVLLTIYWIIRFPERFGIGWAWLIGLLLDGIEGSPMGQHALALAVVAYATLILLRRLQLLVTWQQAGVVFMLVGVFELLCLWIESIVGTAALNLKFLMACSSSALAWPVLRLLLDRPKGR